MTIQLYLYSQQDALCEIEIENDWMLSARNLETGEEFDPGTICEQDRKYIRERIEQFSE